MFPAEQSGWERSPTHGPGADSQRIADGDMARPAGQQAEDTGSPAQTTRHAALVFLRSEPGMLGGPNQTGSSLRGAERAEGPLKPGEDHCPTCPRACAAGAIFLPRTRGRHPHGPRRRHAGSGPARRTRTRSRQGRAKINGYNAQEVVFATQGSPRILP